MGLNYREHTVLPNGHSTGPRHIASADQLPVFNSQLGEILSISDTKRRRGPAANDRTQTMALRQAAVTCVRGPKRRGAPWERMRSLTGRTVSHYRIVAKLGNGGMGVVYRAKDVRLQRHVALKIPSNDLLTRLDPYVCMLREAQAGSVLNHPNVCTVYEFGEFQGLPFLVMELLEGRTLKERIKESWTLERFLRLAIQICDGLDAVHSKRIVHRDIKPSNLFITTAGHAKIFDFGLAIIASGSAINQHQRRGDQGQGGVPTDPALALGTPLYMSPEHSLGEALDGRADLFSLGLVFYELLTGQRPFRVASPREMTKLLTSTSLAPLSLYRRDLPVSVAHLVEKMLEQDRDCRYQGAAEVRADLKRIQRELGFGECRRWKLAAAACV